jgi:midasin
MEAGQEEEGMPQEELSRQDQNVQENETLALPEDMDIEIDDGGEESGEDDDLDGLSDTEKPEEKQPDVPEDVPQNEDGVNGNEEHQKDETIPEQEAEQEDEIDAAGDREDEMGMEMDDEEQGEEGREEDHDEERKQPLQDDGTGADQDNVTPSDVQNGGGQAEDANMQDDAVENKAAQREQGALGKQASEEDKAPGNKGALSSLDQEQAPSDEPEDADTNDAQPFKKLGDALERWYRNQRDIQAASESQDETEKSAEDMARAEFQHLQDENAEADAQALGTATNEEARPMDDAMAVDTEMGEGDNHVLPEDDNEEDVPADVKMEDAELKEPQEESKNEREDGRSGVATRKGAFEKDDKDQLAQVQASSEDAEDEQVEETSTQLLATHITEEDEAAKPLRDYQEALELWTGFQTKTQALSQSLSSQLRLILTPTQSTKLSGSFRTGKRLNIKKIIPYIASSYKRDKIWMRRAIPSKRAYQILLCVDDSSSMSDDNRSASGRLALESLVMVARALTVLEAGQIGVLGFGTDVFVAHALTDPSFTSADAGARVLQKFTFAQDGTDMTRLLRTIIDHFRDARLLQASAPGGEDLWQLALILSDGLVQSSDHARLRPLLREAMEQRVMVVFIVMDDAREGKKGHSVLELKEARFGPDGVPVIHRYLDSFPFPYYLIVHHLEDLPGALAALLRTWFAEVNS